MASSTSKRRSSSAPLPAASRIEDGDPLRGICLAVVSGLFFVRWWQPTEGTSLGGTLPIALGWFLALALAGWLGLRGTAWRVRCDGLLGAVGLLCAGHVISGMMVVLTRGDGRAAINMAWEWASLAVSFLLLRSALATPTARREWTVVALAAVLTLGGYGLTQRFVFYPQMVAQYERLRQEMDSLEEVATSGGVPDVQRMQKLRSQMLANGISAHMLSGSGRTLLEGRLKHSSEPLGRFALANTFAGLLLVWWLLLIFQSVQVWRDRPAPQRLVRLTGLSLCLAVIGYCLLLTKSRTAYVGGVCGLLIWSLAGQWQRHRQRKWIGNWRRLAIGGLGAGAVVAGILLVAGMTGGLDRLVLAEAPKSLQYRLEYWWSSLKVIADSPLMGVGPGQFRQHYLAHKLPRSSEEIADPHNLVLDVWANGGLLALAGLVSLVVIVIRSQSGSAGQTSRVGANGKFAGDPPEELSAGTAIPVARTVAESGILPKMVKKVPQPKVLVRIAPLEPEVTAGLTVGWSSPIRWGGLVGLLALWLLEGALETSVLGFLLCWLIAMWVIERLLPDEAIQPLSWIAACLGLVVHLCGAGGIAMPAITQLLLLLAICAVQQQTTAVDLLLKRWNYPVVLVGGIGLFLGGFWTAAQPGAQAETLMTRADFAKLPSQREQLYQQAALADPWAVEPWERLAEILFSKWRSSGDSDDGDFPRAVAAQRAAIDRNPYSFHTHRALSLFYSEHAAKSGNVEDQQIAVKEMETAIQLYPHNAELQADAAEVFVATGRRTLAATAARRAVEQDQINHAAGHTDKWLIDKIRQRMEQLATGR